MIKIEGGEFPSSPSITGKDRIGGRSRNSERKTIRTIMQGDLVSIAKMIEERMISFVKRKKAFHKLMLVIHMLFAFRCSLFVF